MAAALVGTMRNPAAAQAQAGAGRALVLRTYDWDALADKLEMVWEKRA